MNPFLAQATTTKKQVEHTLPGHKIFENMVKSVRLLFDQLS